MNRENKDLAVQNLEGAASLVREGKVSALAVVVVAKDGDSSFCVTDTVGDRLHVIGHLTILQSRMVESYKKIAEEKEN